MKPLCIQIVVSSPGEDPIQIVLDRDEEGKWSISQFAWEPWDGTLKDQTSWKNAFENTYAWAYSNAMATPSDGTHFWIKLWQRLESERRKIKEKEGEGK